MSYILIVITILSFITQLVNLFLIRKAFEKPSISIPGVAKSKNRKPKIVSHTEEQEAEMEAEAIRKMGWL